jgi:uncharacterized protein (TIGR02246 family)
VKTIQSAAFVAAALLALGGCAQMNTDTTADEAEIRKMAPAWADAFNAQDVDKLVGMYWDDAVLQPPGASSKAGAAAIREFLTADTANAKAAGMTLNIPESGAVDVSGDLAYEAGSFTVTDTSGAVVDSGKYLGVFEKRDGAWRYIRDTWNSDNPPAPAAAPAAEAAPAA